MPNCGGNIRNIVGSLIVPRCGPVKWATRRTQIEISGRASCAHPSKILHQYNKPPEMRQRALDIHRNRQSETRALPMHQRCRPSKSTDGQILRLLDGGRWTLASFHGGLCGCWGAKVPQESPQVVVVGDLASYTIAQEKGCGTPFSQGLLRFCQIGERQHFMVTLLGDAGVEVNGSHLL